MIEILDTWAKPLEKHLSDETFLKIGKEVALKRKIETVIPATKEEMFRCFYETPFNKVIGVIVGMDPYSTPGLADGLCFSTSDNNKTPASLRKIHKAIEESCYDNFRPEQTNDLCYLAKQGILMLNCSLSVAANVPGSHEEYWVEFSKAVFKTINGISYPVFVLALGKSAQKYTDLITNDIHQVIKVEHPAASAYQNREWNYEDCFKKINNFMWTNYGPLSLIRW